MGLQRVHLQKLSGGLQMPHVRCPEGHLHKVIGLVFLLVALFFFIPYYMCIMSWLLLFFSHFCLLSLSTLFCCTLFFFFSAQSSHPHCHISFHMPSDFIHRNDININTVILMTFITY